MAPEFQGELIRLPEAFEPGITAKMLEALPPIDDERLRAFKRALDKVFPDDMGTMEEVLALINVETR